METGDMNGDNNKTRAPTPSGSKDSVVALCASCDRCRARKTKCDGNRPCGNCATKYMKKHKITSIEGIDLAEFECVYSPAKRRGPIPGKTGQARKANEMAAIQRQGSPQVQQPQQQPGSVVGDLQQAQQIGGANPPAAANPMAGLDPQTAAAFLQAAAAAGGNPAALQQQLGLLQQFQQQQQRAAATNNGNGGGYDPMIIDNGGNGPPPTRRVKREVSNGSSNNSTPTIPRTITRHTHLLERNDPEGTRLLAYYKLSIDEMFRLPPTPTDEEYCSLLLENSGTPAAAPYAAASMMIPGSHLAALSAARFAEIALGALVHNELSLAVELCNAVVHCLRESAVLQQEASSPGNAASQQTILYQVAKAYFLLGTFRACRGDMGRYFKYRRVCMTHLSKLKDDAGTDCLLASMSYLDAWAYMVYNANEKMLPAVDDLIPPVACGTGRGCGGTLVAPEAPGSNGSSLNNGNGAGTSSYNSKFNIKTDVFSIASDPKNQNWIQGAPPVYLKNEAPLHARSLDAIACAVRTCCDQANSRFNALSAAAKQQEQNEANGGNGGNAMNVVNDENDGPGGSVAGSQRGSNGGAGAANGPGNAAAPMVHSPTTTAVLAHENELCSRNMILSAYTLMQQNDAKKGCQARNEGTHMVISAMDAFLENSDDAEGQGGFTDSQIQSLLSVCNTALENPYLLHHAGPSYHMVSNAAILLCHLLNGMYAMRLDNASNDGSGSGGFGNMEATLFEEVLDTFIPIRKLLTIHRRKLPVQLRCHGIPRPSVDPPQPGQPFIDLGETLLCACRGCQGFVLMACSPCVAAERAASASHRQQMEMQQEARAYELEMGENNGLDQQLNDLGHEFDLDDDALLGMISNLISN